jgi:hypothetical protein
MCARTGTWISAFDKVGAPDTSVITEVRQESISIVIFVLVLQECTWLVFFTCMLALTISIIAMCESQSYMTMYVTGKPSLVLCFIQYIYMYGALSNSLVHSLVSQLWFLRTSHPACCSHDISILIGNAIHILLLSANWADSSLVLWFAIQFGKPIGKYHSWCIGRYGFQYLSQWMTVLPTWAMPPVGEKSL